MSEQATFSDRGFDLATLYKALFLAVVVVFVATPLLAPCSADSNRSASCGPYPFGLPQVWEWENYGGILMSKRYWQLLGNS